MVVSSYESSNLQYRYINLSYPESLRQHFPAELLRLKVCIINLKNSAFDVNLEPKSS